MRVLTVVFDRLYGEAAWIVVENGLPVAKQRFHDLDVAVAAAEAIARLGHRLGDPRDVRINHRDGHRLVCAPLDCHATAELDAASEMSDLRAAGAALR
jgi:hypothetical protein